MKINAGMRCHDICPKMELEELFGQVKAAGVTPNPAGNVQIHFQLRLYPPATTARASPAISVLCWRKTEST